jgi:epoxide hydrolase
LRIRDYRITFPADELERLRRKLNDTRWPQAESVSDWSQGTPLGYLREFCAYWANTYDPAPLLQRLDNLPQFVASIDDAEVHFVHVRAANPDAPALLMTHGWPGSIVEFLKAIAPLSESDPAHAGGLAFHLVLPTLPGYGYSSAPPSAGWGVERIASTWARLMSELGYTRYFAQGGDWGAAVTTQIALQDPTHCVGMHTNMPIVVPRGDLLENLTANEESALAGRKFYQRWDSGYSKQQSTRPQTVGYGLVDSPAGLAGWIVEKFYQWTDCNGDLSNVLSRDELIDNLMMYWMPGAGASSGRLYWESFGRADMRPVTIPSGVSMFPKEIFRSSERWVRSRYTNLVHFSELDVGGHFAAFECPDVFVSELKTCFAKMR